MILSSDPHAWLRPCVAALKADPAFTKLAPALRFEALCQVEGVDHPDRARRDLAEIRAAEWKQTLAERGWQ